MLERQVIKVSELMLDTENFRTGKQADQKAAREAIMIEQGPKLAVLAADICTSGGLSPIDLPIVVPNEDGAYTVVEGNRRTLALKMIIEPSLADGFPVHKRMLPLNKKYADIVPKEILCVVAPSKKAAMPWIRRKHASGLEGAGTEPWSSVAKDRADELEGMKSPSLAVYNYVLQNPSLDPAIKEKIEGPKFNYSTVGRLIGDKSVQRELGLKVRDGKVTAHGSKKHLQSVLTDMFTIIATGKRDGEAWTVRDIDKDSARKAFAQDIAKKHGPRGKASKPWAVGGPTSTASASGAGTSTRQRASTNERPTLVPRDCKISLPSGKINDLFMELKTLKIDNHRNAVGILFRVFLEFSMDDYMKRRAVAGASGLPLAKDNLENKFRWSVKDVETSKLMTYKEATPMRTGVNDVGSYLSAQVLNSFVHNPASVPDSSRLKVAWGNAQLFLERIWKP